MRGEKCQRTAATEASCRWCYDCGRREALAGGNQEGVYGVEASASLACSGKFMLFQKSTLSPLARAGYLPLPGCNSATKSSA